MDERSSASHFSSFDIAAVNAVLVPDLSACRFLPSNASCVHNTHSSVIQLVKDGECSYFLIVTTESGRMFSHFEATCGESLMTKTLFQSKAEKSSGILFRLLFFLFTD